MLFNPVFQTTPHLLKILEEISSLNTRIKDATVGVRWIPSLQKDAIARLAHGSTAIEGNPLTLSEVKILADGGDLPHAQPRAVQEVLNYFVALKFIEKNSGITGIAEKDVLKLHAIIGQKGALDRPPVGTFRTYGVRVGEHVAPPALEVPKLMRNLLDWLNGPGQAWPPLIGSAILHYQFEFIHPFGDGNGRVGRALATWELYRRAYDTHHIFALDEVLLDDRQSYYRALHRVQIEKHDLTGWVEYIAEATREALTRAWKRVDVARMGVKGKQLILTPKQEKLLSLLRHKPLGIGDIQKELKVTKPGAHHILKSLLATGIVVRAGGHRTGNYRLK